MEETEIEAVSKRFGTGHRHSTLLDQFGRLSFEIHLNQAILRRSLSEPSAAAAPPPPVALVSRQDKNRGWRKAAATPFRKAMRKLLRPFRVSRRREMVNGRDDATSIASYASKRFSRSVRV